MIDEPEPDDEAFARELSLHHRRVSNAQFHRFKAEVAEMLTTFGMDLDTPSIRDTPAASSPPSSTSPPATTATPG